MKVTDITSTTTPYLKTATTQSASSQIKSASSTPVTKTGGVAETKASASTTPTSKTASATITSNAPNKTASVKCASATIVATSSTTISYKGASTTVKAAGSGNNASATVKSASTGNNASSTVKAAGAGNNASATVKAASAGNNASSTVKSASTGSNASATVKSASAGNNASSTVKAGVSASSTTKATNASATPSASTTLYPYLAHMGGDAKQQVAKILKDIEMYNGTLENNVVDEKELDLALQRFKNEFKVETSSLYSEKMVNAIKNVGLALRNISEVKQQLTDLDFYDVNGKEKIDALDISKQDKTNNYVEGLRNFCRLYNVKFSSDNMGEVVGKLKEADDMYHQVVDKVVYKSVNFEELQPLQAKSLGKIWTFLKIGMGVNNTMAAAILGNSFAESRLNEGQVQNTVENPDSYQYKLNDNVGYGLFQWTYPSRKNDLIKIAESMNMGINNINSQLETLKSEVLSNDYKSMWLKMNNTDSCEDATTLFFDYYEMVGDDTLVTRKKAARYILDLMN